MIASKRHWGVYRYQALVAIATMRLGGVVRLAHTADIGPFYVTQAAQRQGIARALLGAMLEHTRSIGLKRVELTVDVENSAAHMLYEGFGFKVFGTRPRSVIIDGAPRDDHLMVHMLD